MKSYFWLLVSISTCTICCSQTGPGGVGKTDGTSPLKIWYVASEGVSTSGALINSVANSAGISALDISESGAQRPTLILGAVNGFDAMSFSGSNRLQTGLNLTTSNFITNQASSFMVNRADNVTQRSSVYTTSPLNGNRFSNHIPWSRVVYYDIGACCGSSARISVGSLSGLTSYSFWSYDASPATGKQLYRNGTLLQNRSGTSTFANHSSYRFNLGGNVSGTAGFRGDITEVIVFSTKVNTAQRIIIENYLAAKYGLTSSSNDLYINDNSANGNFDFDVAGIGRIDNLNQHNDSQGTGIVRILNPTELEDDEFLIWGHQNGNLLFDNTIDIPANIKSRLNRVWRVNEVSTTGASVDVGGVDIRFDLTGLGTISATDLRLLVDTDNDGFFNDENPIAGAISLGNNIYAFNNQIALQNNYRFTISKASYSIITNKKITYRVK